MILDMDNPVHYNMWEAAKKDFFDNIYYIKYPRLDTSKGQAEYTRHVFTALGEVYNMVHDIDYDNPKRPVRTAKFDNEKDYLMFVLKWS